MKVIAILQYSADNETIRDMWKEAKAFDPQTPVIEIIKWANQGYDLKYGFKRHLEITVDEERD